MATSEDLATIKTEKEDEKNLRLNSSVYKGKQQDKASEMAVIRHIQLHDQLESSIARLASFLRQINDGLVDFESDHDFDDIQWCRAYVKTSAATGAQGPDAASAAAVVQMADCCEEYRDLLAVTIPKVCPNLAMVAGDLLAARLIAKAGSAVGLALMSASSVTMLNPAPPGIRRRGRKFLESCFIQQSGLVQGVAVGKRLRMGRYLANKCVLAVREDCFGLDRSTDFGYSLRCEVEELAQTLAPNTEGAPGKTSPNSEDDEDFKD